MYGSPPPDTLAVKVAEEPEQRLADVLLRVAERPWPALTVTEAVVEQLPLLLITTVYTVVPGASVATGLAMVALDSPVAGLQL